MKVGLKRGIWGLAGTLALLAGPAFAGTPGPLSQPDARTAHTAFKAAENEHWQRARAIVARVGNPLAGELIDWMEMTRPGNRRSFADIAAFAKAHPDWPYHYSLMRRAEEAMDASTPDAKVRDWFHGSTPLTTEGRTHLIAALMAAGERRKAQQLIRQTWIEGNFGRRQERDFLRQYRKYLSAADHAKRLDDLLWDGRDHQARRLLRHVGKPLQKLALARIALREFKGGVDWYLRQVPQSLRSDPGLVYERVRWRRRKGLDEDAYALLRKVPATAPHPELWWSERSILARRLLAKGDISAAYRLAIGHGLSDGVQYVEAEWLSGWIALRYLNEPKIALRHFERIDRYVQYPISKARAAYWAGRAAEAAGDAAKATDYFRKAARFDTTYYGQLAAAQSAGSVKLERRHVVQPSGAEKARFEANTRVRAIRLLHQVGERDLVKPFVDTLLDDAKAPEDYLLVAELSKSLGRRDLGVYAARKAQLAGVLLPDYAYPILKINDGKPEEALIHAIARQESNFDADAVSSAGARGMMQLMPRTAKAIARHLRIRFSRRKLESDAHYNIRLARSYLGQLLERFNGSYVLAIAAYNAGPAAAARWTRQLGEPGEAGSDPIDWIEMIPYRETRNYVQRVLENLQVYRVRLEGPMLAEAIVKDLSR